MGTHHPLHFVQVEKEVARPLAGDDRGGGHPGDVPVQRVGGLEQGHLAARPAVGQQQRLEDLVRPVGTEDLLGADPVAVGQRPAQTGRLAIRVAVEVDGGQALGEGLEPFGRWRQR